MKLREMILRLASASGPSGFELGAQAVAEELRPIQERLAVLMADKAQLTQLMKDGAEKAQYVAARTLAKAQKKMGYVMLK